MGGRNSSRKIGPDGGKRYLRLELTRRGSLSPKLASRFRGSTFETVSIDDVSFVLVRVRVIISKGKGPSSKNSVHCATVSMCHAMKVTNAKKVYNREVIVRMKIVKA